jgi:large subunit ribosomal protein L19
MLRSCRWDGEAVPGVLLSGNQGDPCLAQACLAREGAEAVLGPPVIHPREEKSMITSENLQQRDVTFKPGDTVRVHYRVIEGNRERIQVFEGLCISRKGGGVNETFTVRKNSFGVAVERIFPLHSPKIAKIEVVSRGAVRRAKLYYIREKVGRKARVKKAR